MFLTIPVKKICRPIIYLVLACTISCKENNNELKPVPSIKKRTTIIVELQPLGKIPGHDIEHVFNELKKVYPNIIINRSIEIPSSCYYKSRNRYRADSIIHYLSRRTGKEHITIGLTNLDISTTKNEVKDFGIMGLGFNPGNACIASSFRLSKQNKQAQFFKVAIHELGHTQGLGHCPEKLCFMRDAEGKNPIDEENAFCNSCKSTMKRKGWQF